MRQAGNAEAVAGTLLLLLPVCTFFCTVWKKEPAVLYTACHIAQYCGGPAARLFVPGDLRFPCMAGGGFCLEGERWPDCGDIVGATVAEAAGWSC